MNANICNKRVLKGVGTILITDTVAEELRTYVRGLGPLLGWGLLFGLSSKNETAILKVVPQFNASCFPMEELAYDSSVAPYLF